MIDLVALDMAGTTIDDHGAVYVALRRSVEQGGATVADADLQTWMGTDKERAIQALLRLGGRSGDDAEVREGFARFRRLLDEAYRDTPPAPLPGVLDAFERMRGLGVRIALTTGFDDGVVGPLLDSLGWRVGETVDAVVTTSDVPAGRPAPYLIHRAMERTGAADVRGVLAAGDTVVDLQAARNAGVIAVGVLSGALGRAELEPVSHDHLLDSVAELPGLPEFRA